jgi:hypothetical protein
MQEYQGLALPLLDIVELHSSDDESLRIERLRTRQNAAKQ